MTFKKGDRVRVKPETRSSFAGQEGVVVAYVPFPSPSARGNTGIVNIQFPDRHPDGLGFGAIDVEKVA